MIMPSTLPRTLRAVLPVLVVSLLTLLPAVRFAAAKDVWIEVRTPNFMVISNAGEKEARRIADQFEQIREVFHSAFPKLRTEIGKPVVIFAVRNEESLKLLLPEYWETKGHTHPAGMYVPGESEHFVAVRTDTQGDNPYEVVYHEYTHALIHLNYRDLPAWLDEGIAEFLGNTEIHEKTVQIGKIDPYHLQELHENKLIPIDTLLQVDHNSPYYNEQNRTSLFYAESWVLVHYLMLDPDARQQQLLNKFQNAWAASGNQVAAAQQTFGDLKKFADKMSAYTRQDRFFVASINTVSRGNAPNYASRTLAPAEVEAQRGAFYVYTRRFGEAKSALDQAMQDDGNLPIVHESLGMLAYYQQDSATAEKEFSRAVQLHSTNYAAYFFDASSQMRRRRTNEDDVAAAALLEKAISMNPQFAPAYAALSSLYSTNPETHDKALAMGRKAIDLEPGNLQYAVSYSFVLLNLDLLADARVMAARIQAASRTPADRQLSQQLDQAIQSRADYDAQLAADKRQAEQQQQSAAQQTSLVTVLSERSGAAPAAKEPPVNKHEKETLYAVEGTISSAHCPSGADGKVILKVNGSGLRFKIVDIKQLQIAEGNQNISDHAPACADWKGRRARLYFYQLNDKEFAGELSTVQFF
jgi:tetratricopeptide (TPR) repeat protein